MAVEDQIQVGTSVLQLEIHQETGDRLEDFPPLLASIKSANGKEGSASLEVERVKDTQVKETPLRDLKNGGDWRALFSAPRTATPQKNWKFSPPELIKGKRVVVAKSSNSTGVCWCDNLVIGFFVGKGFSFSAVKTAFAKNWKLKKEVSIRSFGNGAFIFDFSDEDDRTQVLETGSFYISSKLFTLRPWRPLIEKSVTDIKSVPIWVCIYGIPLHLWDIDGLGLIASFLGKPLLADECTIKKSRLSYARICIEIDIEFDFPKCIPLLVDNEVAFDLPVEYNWRPQKCTSCSVFGHDTKNCSRIVKSRWSPKTKVVNSGAEKEPEAEQQTDKVTSSKTIERVVEIEQSSSKSSYFEGAEEILRLASGSSKSVQAPDLEAAKAVIGSHLSKNKGILITENIGKSGLNCAGERDPVKEAAAAAKANLAGTDTVGASVADAANAGNGAAAAANAGDGVAAAAKIGASTVAAARIGASAADAANAGNGAAAAANAGNGAAAAAKMGASIAAAAKIGARAVAAAKVGNCLAVGNAEGGLDRSIQVDNLVSAGNNEDWKTVKGRKQLKLSPKRNPFMVLSDFKAESRFPINRKLEDEEFELKFRHLSEEQKKVKKQEREMKRLMWNAQPGDGPSPTGGTRSQQKKK